ADLAGRLARQLRLVVDGLHFTGRPGRRTVFGCSGALRHVLAPDRSAVTFAAKADLTGHWIAALLLQLDRDWTWDALADSGFEVRRRTGAGDEVVGTIVLPRTVNDLAVRPDLGIDRTSTELVFFDAIDPKPPPGAFPAELDVAY